MTTVASAVQEDSRIKLLQVPPLTNSNIWVRVLIQRNPAHLYRSSTKQNPAVQEMMTDYSRVIEDILIISGRYLLVLLDKIGNQVGGGGIYFDDLLHALRRKGNKMDRLQFAIMFLLSTDSMPHLQVDQVVSALQDSEIDTFTFQYVKKLKSLNAALIREEFGYSDNFVGDLESPD
ncbi:Sec1-like protein [Artemisia annua]|uniref:Sec1-like protein n=1 Tax=Artemisia annua TaxID=35608 RepID=A0A2U1KC60_ARTAN|nr:Sec1-like protein [Artemisia annua]